MEPIYLDNNATTPILPEVADAMRECLGRGLGNPASQHQAGRLARSVLEDARVGIAEILGAKISGMDSDRLIFTSGGTESNNLALRGLGGREPAQLVISAIEHPSVGAAAEFLESQGWTVQRLGVSASGVVRCDDLPGLLTDETRLVSIMLGNNETGVRQPIEEIAAICQAEGIPLHTDASQAIGKEHVHFRDLRIAAMTCAAHKFHGPRGIGALLVRHDVSIDPILFGGFQQEGVRPGTESVVLAVGMHRALEIWVRDSQHREAHLRGLRDRFEAALCGGWPEVVIHGATAPRLPHTTCVSFPGLDRQALMMALDLAGVACSTGSACASGSSEPSATLLEMGLDQALMESALRLSFGCQNEAAEVDEAASRILRVCNELRAQKTGRKMGRASPPGKEKPL